MQMDKKFRDGKNLFVLPTGIGTWQQQEDIAQPLIDDAIRSVLAA
jgi:3-dehydroquinate synthetase